jgi:hypothetical protein
MPQNYRSSPEQMQLSNIKDRKDKTNFFMVFWFSKLYWLNANNYAKNTILLALANTKYKPERETHNS